MSDGQSEGIKEYGIVMVTGFDLLHNNRPLQKHWVKRLIAYIIDFILSSVFVYWVFFFLVTLKLQYDMFWYFPMTAGMVQVFYSALLEYYSGKTVGKALFKLEVEQLTQDFYMSEALIRNFSKLHGILLLLDWVAGMMTEGDPRQRYLDRIAETTVRSRGEPVHVREYLDDHLFGHERGEEKEEVQEEKEEKRCRECGGELTSISEERYRCKNCGRIQ